MNLQSMTLQQLVDTYNEHASKPIKKFRDKAAADEKTKLDKAFEQS